jgi:hypothetical protein
MQRKKLRMLVPLLLLLHPLQQLKHHLMLTLLMQLRLWLLQMR